MTFEGRKLWHENCLKHGRPSPYADEFAEIKETIEEKEKVAENGLKSKSKGVKK
jgi:hypothetical protein